VNFIYKNFARAILASGIGIGDLQLTVQSGHTLPTIAGDFRLVIWNAVNYPDPADDLGMEIVTASYSGTPNIYNITRAQEDTLDVTHDSGDRAGLHLTAGILENVLPFYDNDFKCFLIDK